VAEEDLEAGRPDQGRGEPHQGLQSVRGVRGLQEVGAQAESKGNVKDSGSSGRTPEFTLNSCDSKVNCSSEHGVWFFGLRSYLINVSKSVSEC